MAPKGRVQIWLRVCQVSESYHISAMTPNSTADAPKTIRPYTGVFIMRTVTPSHYDSCAYTGRAYAEQSCQSHRFSIACSGCHTRRKFSGARAGGSLPGHGSPRSVFDARRV